MLEFRLGRTTAQPGRKGRVAGFELLVDGVEFFEGAVAEPRGTVERQLRHAVEVLSRPTGHAVDVVLRESRRVLCVWRRGAGSVVLASYSTLSPAEEFRGPVELPWLELVNAVQRFTRRPALVGGAHAPNPPAGVVEVGAPSWRLTLDDRDGLLQPAASGARSSAWLVTPGRLTHGTAREPRGSAPPLLRLWALLKNTPLERPPGTERQVLAAEIAAQVVPELLGRNPGLGRAVAMRDFLSAVAPPRRHGSTAHHAPARRTPLRKASTRRPLPSAGALRRLRFVPRWTSELRPEAGVTALVPLLHGVAARGPRDVVRLAETGDVTLDAHGEVSVTLSDAGEVLVHAPRWEAFFGPTESTARWVRSRPTPRKATALFVLPRTVVVGFGDGTAVGLEPHTGALRWAHRPTVPTASVFEVHQHRLWIFSRTGRCQALDLENGVCVQTVDGLGLRETEPVAAHGALWVFTRTRGVSTLWHIRDGHPPMQPPWSSRTPVALAAGTARTLWAVTHEPGRTAVNSFSKAGAATLRATLGGARPQALFAAQQHCVVVDAFGQVSAIGLRGDVLWSRPAPATARLARVPPAFGRNLLIVADDAAMNAIDATTGRTLAQMPRDARLSAMAVDRHGHLYGLTDDGRVTSHQLQATFGLVEGGATSSPSHLRVEPSR